MLVVKQRANIKMPIENQCVYCRTDIISIKLNSKMKISQNVGDHRNK